MTHDAAVDALFETMDRQLSALGLSRGDVDTDVGLVAQGVLDSLSFLEFLFAVEERFGVGIDFSDKDPEEFSSISKIAKLIQNGG